MKRARSCWMPDMSYKNPNRTQCRKCDQFYFAYLLCEKDMCFQCKNAMLKINKPACRCTARPKRYKSKTLNNLNRWFLKCEFCNYFEWESKK